VFTDDAIPVNGHMKNIKIWVGTGLLVGSFKVIKYLNHSGCYTKCNLKGALRGDREERKRRKLRSG
jgi:hypothetical protein